MEELQALVHKLQGSVKYDVLDQIVTKYNGLTEEDKKAVINTLQYWVKKIEIVNEYEKENTEVIKRGIQDMRSAEEKMRNDFNQGVKNLEKQEDASSNKEAEQLIQQI